MAESTKRKRTVLSTEDKVAITKQLEISSANVTAERYRVGKSMVSDIKKNRDKILCFVTMWTSMSTVECTMEEYIGVLYMFYSKALQKLH